MYYRVEPNGAVLYRKSIGSEPVAFPSWEAFAKEHPEAELDLVRRFIEAGLKAIGRSERMVGMFRGEIWIGGAEEGECAVNVRQTLEQGYKDEPELTYTIFAYESNAPDPIANERQPLEYHSETCPKMAAHFAVLALISQQIDPALDELAKSLHFPRP
jgi:hypothetical protein